MNTDVKLAGIREQIHVPEREASAAPATEQHCMSAQPSPVLTAPVARGTGSIDDAANFTCRAP
jgi:hypothetical protein